MTITEFLWRHVPCLKGLTQEQACVLAQACAQQPYTNGQSVLMRGMTVDTVYVVAEGKVGVFVKPSKGNPSGKVGELGPGEIFGEMSIVRMGTASATVKAVEDGAMVFAIPQAAFLDVLAANAEVKDRIAQLIASRRSPSKPAGEAGAST